MATNKLHQSVGSSKSPDGFQKEVVAPFNPKLVTEVEEPVTVSTNCGHVELLRWEASILRVPLLAAMLLCWRWLLQCLGDRLCVGLFRGSPGSCLCALELS